MRSGGASGAPRPIGEPAPDVKLYACECGCAIDNGADERSALESGTVDVVYVTPENETAGVAVA